MGAGVIIIVSDLPVRWNANTNESTQLINLGDNAGGGSRCGGGLQMLFLCGTLPENKWFECHGRWDVPWSPSEMFQMSGFDSFASSGLGSLTHSTQTETSLFGLRVKRTFFFTQHSSQVHGWASVLLIIHAWRCFLVIQSREQKSMRETWQLSWILCREKTQCSALMSG